MYVLIAVAVFGIGLWIGVGAPGVPVRAEGRRHTQKRAINPMAWGRTPGRERQRPRDPGSRKLRLR